jgi:uridylate kinase
VEVVLKATKVDGVYDSDPEKNPHAVKYDRLTYDQVIRDGLRVMDIGAFEMCRTARLPVLVFNYKRERAIEKAVAGHPVGTVVGGG